MSSRTNFDEDVVVLTTIFVSESSVTRFISHLLHKEDSTDREDVETLV
jgi:hypothetical protein